MSNEFKVVPPVRVSLSWINNQSGSSLETGFNLEFDLARNVDIEQVNLAMRRDKIA